VKGYSWATYREQPITVSAGCRTSKPSSSLLYEIYYWWLL